MSANTNLRDETLAELELLAVEPRAVRLTVRIEAADNSAVRSETTLSATPAMIVDVLAALGAHLRPN